MAFFTSKTKLRNIIRELEEEVEHLRSENNSLYKELRMLENDLDEHDKAFPLDLGETVYDVQLRGSNGRYTKTKACKAYSLVNKVVVDKKNYFNLVDRYMKKDIFLNEDDANTYLNSVCID